MCILSIPLAICWYFWESEKMQMWNSSLKNGIRLTRYDFGHFLLRFKDRFGNRQIFHVRTFQYFNFLMCLSHQLLRGNNINNAQPPTDSTKRDFVLKCSSSCRLKILVICLGEYGEEIKEYLDLCLLEFSFTDTLLDRKTD